MSLLCTSACGPCGRCRSECPDCGKDHDPPSCEEREEAQRCIGCGDLECSGDCFARPPFSLDGPSLEIAQ